jgi:hypothetical protein
VPANGEIRQLPVDFGALALQVALLGVQIRRVCRAWLADRLSDRPSGWICHERGRSCRDNAPHDNNQQQPFGTTRKTGAAQVWAASLIGIPHQLVALSA